MICWTRMPNTIDIYQPRYLAEVVRSAPPVHTFLRDTFFTNIKTFATEEVDIDIVKGDREMAAFVHPKMGAETMEEEGYETKSYKPPIAGEFDAKPKSQTCKLIRDGKLIAASDAVKESLNVPVIQSV